MASKLDEETIDAVLEKLGLLRLAPYINSKLPLECICLRCGLRVTPRVSSLRSGHSGCKRCAGGTLALARRVPEGDAISDMLEAGVKPISTYPGTAHPWQALCLECGEIVSPRLNNVRNGHAACKYCAGKSLTREKAVSLYLSAGAKPTEEFETVNTPWSGECLNCGADVQPRLSDLRRGQGPCKSCGSKLSAKTRKLGAEEAQARMLEAGAKPLEPWEEKRGISDPWLCQCLTCENIITPTVHAISNGQGPCIHCGVKSGSEKNRLDPELARKVMVASGFEPLAAYPGAGEPWMCRCLKCGSEASRRLASIKNGIGCRECAYRNSRIDEEEAVAEMLRRGFRPMEPYEKANLPWLCECLKCGQPSAKRLYAIGASSKNCMHCSERQYGSIVYLVKHQELQAFKVGVGKERRIDEHLSKEWSLVKTWELGAPTAAYKLEGEVLNFIRQIWGLPPYLGKQEMPQGGHTETFSAHDIENEVVCQLISRLLPTV